ncbi:MAG: GNAT family N-acetyltransferase, partial [Microthrixaceae bacterium]
MEATTPGPEAEPGSVVEAGQTDVAVHAVSTRRARLSDLPELTRLDKAARAALGGSRGGELYFLRNARVEPVEDSYRHDLDDPDCLVLLGSIGDVAVGYAVVSAVELAGGYRLADINEIFVETEARDIGVGESLIAEIIEWATEKGCHGLDSRALPGDRSTKNFFESNGLVARAILVHRD